MGWNIPQERGRFQSRARELGSRSSGICAGRHHNRRRARDLWRMECNKMVDRIGDPFLNWFALGLLVFVVIAIFYGIIAIHDIPAQIAKSRHHPHEDAIHAAGWVSLFMLHVLWPFLWTWAMAYRPD